MSILLDGPPGSVSIANNSQLQTITGEGGTTVPPQTRVPHYTLWAFPVIRIANEIWLVPAGEALAGSGPEGPGVTANHPVQV
jgi:hypothetical protein